MKIKKTYPAKLEALEDICADTEEFCSQAGADAKTIYAFNLCLDEIFTNIVTYGYAGDTSKTVSIAFEADGGEIRAEVRDSAPPFNPLEDAKRPDLDANLEERDIGGLGIFFVKKQMDRVCYSYENGENSLAMARKISE